MSNQVNSPLCCNFPLQKATSIIARLDMILAVFVASVIMIMFGIVFGSKVEPTDNPQLVYARRVEFLVYAALALFACVATFYLGLLLKKGSDKNDLKKCKIWYNTSAFLLFNHTCNFIFWLAAWHNDLEFVLSNGSIAVYRAFTLMIVHDYMVELKKRAVIGDCSSGFVELSCGHP